MSGFRIGRKFASHTYPDSRGLAGPPVSVVGNNEGPITLTTTAETIIATSFPMTLDGLTDIFLTVSTPYDVVGGA